MVMIPKARAWHATMPKGYTTVEVLVVLTIVLLMLASTRSVHTGRGHAQQETDINMLVALLNEARLSALRMREQVGACVLDKRQECVTGTGRTLSIFVQHPNMRTVLSRYTLQHPKAHIVIVGGRRTALLQFKSDGSAHTFGSAYYCVPNKQQSEQSAVPHEAPHEAPHKVPRLTLSLEGHLRQSSADSSADARSHCER